MTSTWVLTFNVVGFQHLYPFAAGCASFDREGCRWSSWSRNCWLTPLGRQILFRLFVAQMVGPKWSFGEHSKWETETRRWIIWRYTLPETNSKFAPENGWLRSNPFLWGWPIFRGYVIMLVSGRVKLWEWSSMKPLAFEAFDTIFGSMVVSGSPKRW